MLRKLIGAAILALLLAAPARAQVTGPIPNTPQDYGQDFRLNGWPMEYEQTRTLAQIERDNEIERQYRETLRKIPDRKPSNDPWRNIRQAPAVAYDRHRPQ